MNPLNVDEKTWNDFNEWYQKTIVSRLSDTQDCLLQYLMKDKPEGATIKHLAETFYSMRMDVDEEFPEFYNPNSAYASMSRTVRRLKSRGLVQTRKEGRSTIVYLTV